MSLPNKSNDKNRRYPPGKSNDFVNNIKGNDRNRGNGWANLGRVSNRRVPPPAKVPSMKSETGMNNASFDLINPSSGTTHGWTANNNQISSATAHPLTPTKASTQQQLDSLPANGSTPTTSSMQVDSNGRRLPSSWSSITAGSGQDQPPNLLGLNDFPHLATQDSKNTKSPSDNSNNANSSTSTTTQAPSLRPANISSWKEGGGRVQPVSTDSTKESIESTNSLSISTPPSVLTMTTTNTLHSQSVHHSGNNSSYMRTYPSQQSSGSQMWNYGVANPYGSNQSSSAAPINPMRHQAQTRSSTYGNQTQNSRGQQISTDYKAPSILKNQDIDNLSKLTDNFTWASASQEVNYEEKIRFSDDEDIESEEIKKNRRYLPQGQSRSSGTQSNQTRSSQMHYGQASTRSRLIQEDQHVKQLQDDKSSEMINTLNVAKQRRDEQERHLRPKTYDDSQLQRNSAPKYGEENKPASNYQARPLLSSTTTAESLLPSGQSESNTAWTQNSTTSRPRQDTADSQSFMLKSWSDQMDSFNYASLHEKSTGDADVDDHHERKTTTTTSTDASSVNKYSRSHSESSSQSQIEHDGTINRSKHFSTTTSQPIKAQNSASTKKQQGVAMADSFPNYSDSSFSIKTQDRWNEWDDNPKSSVDYVSKEKRYQSSYNDHHRSTVNHPSEESTRPSDSNYENNRNKGSNTSRPNVSRPAEGFSNNNETRSNNSKTQSVWRPLSPTRPADLNDPTPQESTSFKLQSKSNETSGNHNNERRQGTMVERKTRYSNTLSSINTASIPPLMSVRSEVLTPSTNVSSKHFKTGNNLHYSQRNDFYNDNNDSTWVNDDDYYEDETGYYDSNVPSHSRHHSSMTYQSHHRGYTALGSYGRYRRGGVLRHQQQYSSYSSSNASGSQLNTSFGSKSKKSTTSKLVTQKKDVVSSETNQMDTVTDATKESRDESVNKALVKTMEPQSNVVEEIPINKSTDVPATKLNELEPVTTEKISIPTDVKPLLEIDTETLLPSTMPQVKSESSTVNSKKATSTSMQKRGFQDQRQTTSRHRTTYERSVPQEYESSSMANHNYYNMNNHRGARGLREQDLSGTYYYGHNQQRYASQYNYSHEPYHLLRGNNRLAKRGSSTKGSDRQPTKSATSTGSNTKVKSHHPRNHSTSDNDQKEGEEWETASESSTNMRPANSETVHTATLSTTRAGGHESKSIHKERTPPKKSFTNQRPLPSTRHIDSSLTHRRGHTLHERGSKVPRSLTHRSARSSSNMDAATSQKTEIEAKVSNQTGKKDPHRHSLEGYDLNNVAGVVKIETLPPGALEEEGSGFEDDGEEFCVVMSKRDRKEQKAAQLSKQNAIESNHSSSTTNVDVTVKTSGLSNANDIDEQIATEKLSTDSTNQRNNSGKSASSRLNSKSSNQNTRQHNNKAEHQNASMYYYHQNSYYYYNQNQYHDQESYYKYGNYNTQHRQTGSRKKTRQTQNQENLANEEHPVEKKPETHLSEKNNTMGGNVMSHIDMWEPQTENTMSNNSKKLIEKPNHNRKFANEVVSSSNETSMTLPQRSVTELPSHSPISKTNESIARTIKPPNNDGKSDRDNKKKPTNFDKNDTMASLAPTQLFEKTPFLDYDDKHSIGAPNDDYNQKISSLKMIWDTSEQTSEQLEQTINTMVAMQQQQQENPVSTTNSTKTETYVKESISVSTAPISVQTSNIASGASDDGTKKTIASTGASSALSASNSYVNNPGSTKNEQKNICTVKPTQQVAPNIQDPTDSNVYSPFTAAPLPPTLSQPQMTPQQHILPQAPLNPVHPGQSFSYYDNMGPMLSQAPGQFGRIYSSNSNNNSSDPPSSDFSNLQSSTIYAPQNFPFRNTNLYIQPSSSVPNTSPIYHHTPQHSITTQQNNPLPPPPPPMHNYANPYLMDHGAHMLGQAQPPPPAYINNQMMPGRPQQGPYYRGPPQQQLPTPPGPPYGTQDPLAHSQFYHQFFPNPSSNAPPPPPPPPPPQVAHNIYRQNDNFPPAHPQMFARAGSIDRNDHSSISRPANYSSSSSNQPNQPSSQQGPPSLLSQPFKAFPTGNQANSSANLPPYYQPTLPSQRPQSQSNQYNHSSMSLGSTAMNNPHQSNMPVPSLMGNVTTGFSNNGKNSQTYYQTSQPLINSQPNNNRPPYHHQTYSHGKPAVPNDDNLKPKRI